MDHMTWCQKVWVPFCTFQGKVALPCFIAAHTSCVPSVMEWHCRQHVTTQHRSRRSLCSSPPQAHCAAPIGRLPALWHAVVLDALHPKPSSTTACHNGGSLHTPEWRPLVVTSGSAAQLHVASPPCVSVTAPLICDICCTAHLYDVCVSQLHAVQ